LINYAGIILSGLPVENYTVSCVYLSVSDHDMTTVLDFNKSIATTLISQNAIFNNQTNGV